MTKLTNLRRQSYYLLFCVYFFVFLSILYEMDIKMTDKSMFQIKKNLTVTERFIMKILYHINCLNTS